MAELAVILVYIQVSWLGYVFSFDLVFLHSLSFCLCGLISPCQLMSVCVSQQSVLFLGHG